MLHVLYYTTDSEFTTMNICSLLKDVNMTPDDWERTGEILGICKSARNQVKCLRECGHNDEVKETILKHYVTEYPLASWKDLIKKLQQLHYSNAAEMVKGKYVHEGTTTKSN